MYTGSFDIVRRNLWVYIQGHHSSYRFMYGSLYSDRRVLRKNDSQQDYSLKPYPCYTQQFSSRQFSGVRRSAQFSM